MILKGLEKKGVVLLYQTLGLTDVCHFHTARVNQFHEGFEVELCLTASLKHMDVRGRVIVGPKEELETVFCAGRWV
jgi:hypothetical protein